MTPHADVRKANAPALTDRCLVHMEPDVRVCRGCAADRLAGEAM